MAKLFKRLIKVLAALLALALVLVVIFWWLTKPTQPDDFYAAPANMPDKPGILIKTEPFTKQVPHTSRAWRILYSTTRFDGKIAAASAIVLAPRVASGLPSNAVVWTHGTTGVAPACGPSVMERPFANVPALEEAIAAGWIIVATDYIGLGTEGPHPYLIGEGQARSALDSLRALSQVKDVLVTGEAVVWGHSQGGNAAIWTGILAPQYAPELKISGVAAAAPATNLVSLVQKAKDTPVGIILSSYIITAYSETYADVPFDDNVRPAVGWLVKDMATRCMEGTKALFVVGQAMLTGGSIFSSDPSEGALGTRLRENTPTLTVTASLMIAQGEADELVLPEIQTSYVKERCSAGQMIEYKLYPGLDHLKLVAKDSPLTGDLINWTRDRFDGKPPNPGCKITQ